MRVFYNIIFLIIGLASVLAFPGKQQRIIGGSITTIDRYPFAASLLFSWNLQQYTQSCGGTIITNRAVLSAAHCFYGDSAARWRIRVGSSFANTGGDVHNTAQIIIHPNFDYEHFDSDLAIMRVATPFVYNNRVRAGSIAGVNYNLADNQAVWAVGWGLTAVNGTTSEQLRHVQIWSINQSICKSRYNELGEQITENMLCSGWLNVGGRDQCQGDSGGPLLHNNVVVGVCSWGEKCALARYPGVNTRVSRFTSWIQANA
ncbi:PREDICTED: trypsin CFT-1-like [Papilio xuthus]|uniref:trypsin n=1 Tax=Papilio xuthus TaxID=66420 RepID=A0AAJ7EFV8_PAPXU|nr:PREDICTED: trypsin CFT-1-like [Papilio xuthus]